jgi:hypothetical protein
LSQPQPEWQATVNLPKSRTTRTATAVGIAGISALMIFGPGSTVAADAARRIGSAAIKNNAVRSIDIRNETIRGNDVKDGSLTAKDFSGTMRGAPGPRGPAGPAGRNGTNGAPGGSGSASESAATWSVAHQFNSSNSGEVIITTQDTIPTDRQIEAIAFNSTGDFDECPFNTAGMTVTDGGGHLLASSSWNAGTDSWRPATLTPGGALNITPTKLRLRATCGYEGPMGQLSPVPAFEAQIKVILTQRNTTETATLN